MAEFIWLAVIKNETEHLVVTAFKTDDEAWKYVTKKSPKYGQIIRIPLYGNMYDYELRTHDEKEDKDDN